MKTTLVVLGVVALVLLVLALAFGFSFLAYWLVLKAGAPKYVAVIVGIFVFVLSGLSANKSK